MENMANNSDLDIIPKVSYENLDSLIQSGDILFYSGEDEVSKLIRWATHSIWSHIGILFKFQEINRILLLESVESMGVRLIPLSKYIKNIEREEEEEDFYARLVIARHEDLPGTDVSALMNFGIDQITRPYDREEIQRIMIRIAKGEGKAERDRAFMCSELVYECFIKAGVEIPYNHLGFISPEDIWKDPKIHAIAEIDHL